MAETIATGNPIHCTCGGTGQYVVEETDERPGGSFSGLATNLCACRLAEPPREGSAAWWTSETVKEMEHESATGFDTILATIGRERPVSQDNHRLIRTEENTYYPAMAVLEAEFGQVGFTSAMLRDLAKWLTEVADEVDRIDKEIS